jgi:hypothetical protein
MQKKEHEEGNIMALGLGTITLANVFGKWKIKTKKGAWATNQSKEYYTVSDMVE